MLLVHADGVDGSTTFTDVSTGGVDSPHTLTANNSAQVDTAQKKFGTGSALFAGSDSVTAADSEDWNLGTAAFTVDLWVRYNGVGSDRIPFSLGATNASDGVRLNIRASSTTAEVILAGSTISFTLDSDYSDATWYHIALVRDGSGNVYFFRDGVQQGSTGSNSNNITGGTGGVAIGATTGGTLGWVGWIDEVRLSKGVARWTANFTPPSTAYA